VLLADAVAQAISSGPSSGLRNGDFSVSSPGDPAFGWWIIGDVTVSANAASLGDSNLLFSDLNQTFLVPQGGTALRFTIKSIALKAGTSIPPDAFEVALLDSQSGQALVGKLRDLSETDALLNIQADGKVRFGSKVDVQGVSATGSLTGSGDVVVTISLQGVRSGAVATLYFDLISFASAESSITIDDVQILRGPPIEFGLDPASDSGVPGDDITNQPTVNLAGTTEPRLQVSLDVDDDGFDDGTTTADANGKFTFANVALRSEQTRVRAQATSAEGSSIAARNIILDQLKPSFVAFVINDDESPQRSMIWTLRLHFSESVIESLAPSDFVLRNLTTNTAVAAEAITVLGGPSSSVELSFPNLTGGSLPDGNYLLTVNEAGVTDVAGNTLTPGLQAEFFRYFGDTDGDRDVDFLDWYRFQSTNGKRAGEAGFLAALDFNGDGAVNTADLEAYRPHHLTSLPAAVSTVLPREGRVLPSGAAERRVSKPNDQHARVVTERAGAGINPP